MKTTMLRIAMFSWESLHSIAVGGLAAHVSELAEALHRRGHEVHVFTRLAEGRGRYDCINGVHYHRCSFESSPDFFTYVDRMGNSFVDRMVEAETFYGRPFDVVHGHDWLCAQALASVKNNLRRPVILTMHSTEFGRCGNVLNNGPSSRVREIEWGGTFVADRVICVSKALGEELHSLYGVPRAKLTALYNGVAYHRFDLEVDTGAIRAKHAIGSDDPCILYLGRLAWQKGPDLLLETVPDVLRHHGDTKFLFVGDGEMRQSLQARAADLGLFKSVRFAGYRSGDELIGLLKTADTVCVPSRNEPFGIVVLEAWSANKPVVVTRNGGPNEFVRDQETGFMVSADRESIGWGLGMALADATNARRIGLNGRREVESRFTWEAVAKGTEEVYGSL
jgi:glycosyltransferase involved in cell wall biosynthesis